MEHVSIVCLVDLMHLSEDRSFSTEKNVHSHSIKYSKKVRGFQFLNSERGNSGNCLNCAKIRIQMNRISVD